MSTPNNGIPYVPEGTQDPAAGLNLSLNVIDVLLQTAVLDMDRTAPPSSPNDGDRHIVASGGTGAWSGQDGNLARYVADGDFWQFFVAGTQVHVVLNLDDGALYAWDGAAWAATGGIPEAPIDGNTYGRKDGDWEVVTGGGAPTVVLAGTSYTLDDLTPGAWHVFTSGSAVTITVEDDSVEPVPADAEYGLEARGSGGVTIVEDNDAEIIPPKGGTLELETGDFAVLKRTDEDEYKLVGSTVAV